MPAILKQARAGFDIYYEEEELSIYSTIPIVFCNFYNFFNFFNMEIILINKVGSIGGIVAVLFIDRIGIRKLLLKTLPFCAVCMFYAAWGLYYKETYSEKAKIKIVYSIIICFLLFAFFFNSGMDGAVPLINR